MIIQDEILKLLHKEVVPAMGCTEPVAVALCVAKAKSLLTNIHDDTIEIRVSVSPNIYKNGLGVGIPGTQSVGLIMAAKLGYLIPNPDLSLEILREVNPQTVSLAKDFNRLQLKIADTSEKIYIQTVIQSGDEVVEALITKRHDRFVKLRHNQELVFEAEDTPACTCNISPLYDLPLKDVLESISQMPFEAIGFMIDGLEMNQAIALKGLEYKLGMGVGYGLQLQQLNGNLSNDLMTNAMKLTAAASDARMSGIQMPVMSSNGSGNNGLTAILPIVAYATSHDVSQVSLARATAMSHYINSYIKNAIGRLSAICGCGVAAGTGASVAIAWLMGADYGQIEGVIHNMLANTSGMICDGAKVGCALKLATSASAAVQSALLGIQNIAVPSFNGIIGLSAEESIANLSVLSDKAMTQADHVILDIMREMALKHPPQ